MRARWSIGALLLVPAVGVAWSLSRQSPAPSAPGPQGAASAAPAAVEPEPSAPLEVAEPRNPSPAPPADPPPDERAFLAQLEALNRTDKPRALELARRGEGWYSQTGVQAEARKAMITTLLVDLGRMSEARTEAYRFINAFPESRYRPLVQGVTGIHPRPGRPAPTAAR